MAKIVNHKGKDYVQIGDKLVPVKSYTSDGKPIIGCYSEQKQNENGGIDCTVHVPCFQLGAAPEKPGG